MESPGRWLTILVKKAALAAGYIFFLLHSRHRRAFLFIGRLFGDFIYFFIRKRRLVVYANIIGTIGKTWPRKKVQALVRECYRNLALNFIEFLTFPWQTKKSINSFVHARGTEVYEPLLAEKKGSILLTAHFGNWEILGAWLGFNGYPLYAMNKKQKGIFANLVTEYREMCHINLVFKGSFLKGAMKCLKNGGILGMLADQGNGKVVSFMGKKTGMPYGPASFARKFNAPVIPVFSRRLSNGDHEIIAGPPIEIVKTGDPEKDNYVNTIEFTKKIEQFIIKYPADWFWFHKMFKDLLVPFKNKKL